MLLLTRPAWVLILILPFSLAWGCSPNYRSASSQSQLDYYSADDPWQNQKEGICCFVYKELSPMERAIMAKTVPAQPNREAEKPKAALGAKDEAVSLKHQLQASQAANAALEKERSSLSKSLNMARADVAELRARRNAAERELAAKAAQEKTGYTDPVLRFSEDRENLAARQSYEAQTALNAKTARDGRREAVSAASIQQDKEREAELERSIQAMENALKESGDKTGTVRRHGDSFTVELADKILFDSGSAHVNRDGLKVIKRISASLKSTTAKKMIRVEGHTDDRPVRLSSAAHFLSNWELSAARAGNVAGHLEKEGIKSEQLLAAGYSSTRPVVPNDNDTSRARNRRVDIIVEPNVALMRRS
jgi:chemotaxis protein MotB